MVSARTLPHRRKDWFPQCVRTLSNHHLTAPAEQPPHTTARPTTGSQAFQGASERALEATVTFITEHCL